MTARSESTWRRVGAICEPHSLCPVATAECAAAWPYTPIGDSSPPRALPSSTHSAGAARKVVLRSPTTVAAQQLSPVAAPAVRTCTHAVSHDATARLQPPVSGGERSHRTPKPSSAISQSPVPFLPTAAKRAAEPRLLPTAESTMAPCPVVAKHEAGPGGTPTIDGQQQASPSHWVGRQ